MKNTKVNKTNQEVLGWHKQTKTYLSLAVSSVAYEPNKISKNTAILGILVFYLLDKQGGDKLVLNSINELSSEFEWTVEETKKYLYELANWSHIFKTTNNEGITYTNEFLFKVNIYYNENIINKYKNDDLKFINTPNCEYFKNEMPTKIEIIPNFKYIKDINKEVTNE